MAVRATEESFSQEVLEAQGLVIVDFYSDSCVPCKRMSPVLAEIEEENPDIKLVKVNINFDCSLAGEYAVQSVPTLIFFKDGEEADRIIGAAKKADIVETAGKFR